MPLTLVREGTVASIVRVGGKEEVKRHLENMGFVPGASVTVVSANNGQCDCQCKGIKGCYQQRNGQ